MKKRKFYMLPNNAFRKMPARILLAIITAIIIISFIPHEASYSYTPEKGKPWAYEQLIAPYDFPIYKSQTVLLHERDSLLNLYQPYFDYKSDIGRSNIERLRKDFFAGRMEGIPLSYLPRLTQMLQEVYERGIVTDDDLKHLQDKDKNAIRIVQGKDALATPVKVLFSSRTAYLYIMGEDTATLRRDLMLRCNVNNYLEPNLIYDTEKSESMKEDLLSSVAAATGMVMRGQKVIDRGEIIDEAKYNIIKSLQIEDGKHKKPLFEQSMVYVGKFGLVALFITLLMLYLHLFRSSYYHYANRILLLFAMLAFFPILTYMMVDHKWFSVYMVPYAIVPIFLRIFLDARTALTTYIFLILIASIELHQPYQFVLVELAMGLTAIYSLRELTQRSQLLRTAMLVTLVGCILGLSEHFAEGLSWAQLDNRWYIHIIVQGIFLLFAYPLMLVVEKSFGFTSSVTLIELSNTNNPLLRKMSVVAQGTFNHSMQVANLAAEIANKIGANVQLVRTGALYHDIGKMLSPAFFTENQNGINPHDKISEEKSAQIIISHVTEGEKLADKHSLPRILRDFISTHHGLGKVKYFYIQYRNKYPDMQIDEKLFTYPGPNPSTREQAILMMADAVEATSRSLKNYDEESITKLVNTIVDGQVSDGYFNKCPITFLDITLAKEVMIESLKTIYHTRITYPELKQSEANNSCERIEQSSTLLPKSLKRWGLH